MRMAYYGRVAFGIGRMVVTTLVCLLCMTIIHDVAASSNKRSSSSVAVSSALRRHGSQDYVRGLYQNEKRKLYHRRTLLLKGDEEGEDSYRRSLKADKEGEGEAEVEDAALIVNATAVKKVSNDIVLITFDDDDDVIETPSPSPTRRPSPPPTTTTTIKPSKLLPSSSIISSSPIMAPTTTLSPTLLLQSSEEPSVKRSEEPSVHGSTEPSVHDSTEPSISTSEKPSVHSSQEPSVNSSEKPSTKKTEMPSTTQPTTPLPSSKPPTTPLPTSAKPTFIVTNAAAPTFPPTVAATSQSPTFPPTAAVTSRSPTSPPTAAATSRSPTSPPTAAVTSRSPTPQPTIVATSQPPTPLPTAAVTRQSPTPLPTAAATTTSQSPTTSCPEGTCPNPMDNGICQSKVECFVDPCDVTSCISGVCKANYCGGCHATCVEEEAGGETTTSFPSSQPSESPTTSMLKQVLPLDIDDPLTTAATAAAISPIVQVPKMTFTLFETSGILSTQALEDVALYIEKFLSAELDAYYNNNNNGETYFSGIHLNVVDDDAIARATATGGGRRRKLQDGVVIGTEIIMNGVADFVNEVPPSPAEIVSDIIYLGKRYNEYLISNITSSGNSELDNVHLVDVGYYSQPKGESMIIEEKTLPIQDDEGSGKNILSGMKKKKNESEPDDKSNRFIVIATVAGVATLTFLMFAFTSRSSRGGGRSVGGTRDPVTTVPISIVGNGTRSSKGSGSEGEEDDEVGSDPYIKCHKKGDSHISDLTTLASQPFARIVRTQSELDKDLESLQHYPIVRTQSELEREYERKIMGDEEEGTFVNRCYTHEEEANRVRSCYTQDYSSYYNSSRSRSQEEMQSDPEMMDESYLPTGWLPSSHEGGFWNSLTDYIRKSRSELESSVDENASVSAAGSSMKRSRSGSSQLSCGSMKRSGSQLSNECSDAQLSRASKGSGSRFSHTSTPTSSNMSNAAHSFQRERDNEVSFVDQIDSLHSLKQTSSEVSEHTSDTSSSPRNETLPDEWLTAMHGDNASVVSQPAHSLQSLKQTSSEVSEHTSDTSSSPRNETLPEEWLTAMHGDSASVVSQPAHSLQSLKQTSSEVSEHTSDTSSSPRNETLPEEWLTATRGDSASDVSQPTHSLQSLKQTSSEVSEHTSDASSSPRNETLPEEWHTATRGDSASVVSQPAHSLQSLKQTSSEVSEHTSDTSSSPRNETLPDEWLTATRGDSASVVSQPAHSLQSLKQTSSEVSEHTSDTSSSPRNETLPEEWLTATRGDNASVVSSRDAKSSHDETSSCNEKSGGFLSSVDCDSEEEDSEPSTYLQKKRSRTASVYLQKKRSRTMNEDAFSATSSEEEEDQLPQFPVVEDRKVNMRDSADLLSLVDSIVGSSMGPGPSLADLVWLENKIREKDAASAAATDAMNKRAEKNAMNALLDDQEKCTY